MRLVALAAFALLTACNFAFGLEPTVSLDAAVIDFDGDGITDEHDSTPIVPQPRTSIGIEVKSSGAPACAYGLATVTAGVVPTDGMQISFRASPRIRATYVDYIN